MHLLHLSPYLLALSLCSVSAAAQTPAIGISFNSSKDDTNYDKTPRCEISFNIYNNSAPGTIDRLSIPVSFEDDRGRVVGTNLMQDTIENKGGGFFGDRVRIRVGQSLIQTDSVWVEEECQYVKSWSLNLEKLEDDDCAIRMWPENVTCASLVGVQPSN